MWKPNSFPNLSKTKRQKNTGFRKNTKSFVNKRPLPFREFPASLCQEVVTDRGKDTGAWNAKRFLIILGERKKKKRAQALGLFTTFQKTVYDYFCNYLLDVVSFTPILLRPLLFRGNSCKSDHAYIIHPKCLNFYFQEV